MTNFTYSLRKILSPFFCVLLLLIAVSNKVNATVAAGDLAIIGFNCDPNASTSKTFAIVALAKINAGEVIYFSDKAYYSNAFSALLGNGSEGIFSLTTSSAINAGTVVMFTITSGATPSVTTTPNVGTSTVIEGWTSTSGNTSPFGANGDAILIYQGSEASPSFIFGFNDGNNTTTVVNGWNTGLSTNPNGASELPSSLISGTTAIGFGGTAHVDNWRYNGTLTGTKANLLAAICNTGNWLSDDITEYNLTPGGPVFSGTNPIFSITSPPTTWNGTIWSNGTPTSLIDAIIASSTAPSSFACKTLTVNSGVALTTTGITATVSGDITNNGNGIAGTGGLTIAGNSTISGSNINFNGTLTVNSGAVLTTGGLLTLTSNATNTARVASGSSAGGYISGSVTVQRYIQGSYRKFRFLGHPFAAAMNVTELTDDLDITGAITGSNANAFTATTSNNPSAYTFIEANGNGALNDAGWTAITSGNSVSTIAQGQGIRILVRGTKGQTNSLNGGVYTPAAVTLDMTGSLKQGDFTQSLNFTSVSKGWNLIANPYASNIDWTAVSRTNVDNAVYVYRPSTSAYASWINGSSTNGGSNIIEAGNAFFVRANAASPSLGWQENDKVATAQPATMFRTTNSITNRLSLTLKNETTQSEDEVVLRFGDDPATNSFDKAYDAENLAASTHDLYVLDKQQTKYSIYHGTALYDWQIENRAIALGFTVSAIGTYSITAKTLNALTNGNKAFIQDAFTGTLTEIKDHTTYSFEVTTDAASQNTNRFSIVFNPKEKIAPTIKDFSIKLSPNPAKGMVHLSYSQAEALNTIITITNAAGKQVKAINLGKVQYGIEKIDISRLSKGIYFVRYSNGVETRIEKLVVE